MAMGQVLQNKQPTLHSPHSSHVYRLEYSHTHTHTQETLHINTVQGRERREAETVKFLKAQFKEAGPSL